MIICRCEEVSFKELETTAARYKCSSRELKLRTRAGMGYCGGRTCRTIVDQIAAAANHQNPTCVSLKYQPPIRPVSFKNLGGEDR
ncbi:MULTISPECIES: (2Fe-2S)-binding protein [unclassified Bacillus (in: firmicutes)]